MGTVELTGLEITRTKALGECSAMPTAMSRTIPALICCAHPFFRFLLGTQETLARKIQERCGVVEGNCFSMYAEERRDQSERGFCQWSLQQHSSRTAFRHLGNEVNCPPEPCTRSPTIHATLEPLRRTCKLRSSPARGGLGPVEKGKSGKRFPTCAASSRRARVCAWTNKFLYPAPKSK